MAKRMRLGSEKADEPMRIMQYTYGGATKSGIESYLLDAYAGLDRTRFQFDFVFRYGSPLSAEAERLRNLGASTTALEVDESANPVLRQFVEARRLWRHLRRERPAVIEINMTSAFMNLQAGLLARLSGTKFIIMHAHDSVKHEATHKRLLKAIVRGPLNLVANEHWACSAAAAEYLYGKRVLQASNWTLVRNAVDSREFAFSQEGRTAVRHELGVDDTSKIVGMVGRLTEQKNHRKAIEIFANYHVGEPRSLFVIVGDGPLRDELHDYASELGLRDAVAFTGNRSDIRELMAAMDVLLAPSLHEGFPITVLEAQASGLPVVASQAFPAETNLDGGVTFVPLGASNGEWADAMARVRSIDRRSATKAIFEHGYDRTQTAVELDEHYSRVVTAIRANGDNQ